MTLEHPERFPAMYEDARDRLTMLLGHPPLEVQFLAWPQMWSDLSIGFGGVAGQAITTAQTFVFTEPGEDVFVVYHDYRVARAFRDASGHFRRVIPNGPPVFLPGAADERGWARLLASFFSS